MDEPGGLRADMGMVAQRHGERLGDTLALDIAQRRRLGQEVLRLPPQGGHGLSKPEELLFRLAHQFHEDLAWAAALAAKAPHDFGQCLVEFLGLTREDRGAAAARLGDVCNERKRFFLGSQTRLKFMRAWTDTRGRTLNGDTPYGTNHPAPPADGEPEATPPRPLLYAVRGIDVGGLSQLPYHHYISRCAAPHSPDTALYQSGVSPKFATPYRPEEEGRLALPKHEFGLDIIALIGTLRYAQHRSVPEIYEALQRRRVAIAPRTVLNLLERYEELVTLSLTDTARLQRITQAHGHVVLALDGLQPDVGHEVLWVVRDCLSTEVLMARSLLSATQEDLTTLLETVQKSLCVPILGVISDGQLSIRRAVAAALPDIPHQLCHFHYLREAAKPIYEADRHAKKELKKCVRGVRPIERQLGSRTDPEAAVISGYCSAVRSALTDDGRPPLVASGLKLHDRLSAVSQSLARLGKKGRSPSHSLDCRPSSSGV